MPDQELRTEERILICNNQVFDHHEKDETSIAGMRRIYRPCGNLMKISVQFDAANSPNMVTCLDIDPAHKTGVYISRRWKRNAWGGKNVFMFGPRYIRYFSFVHCSACNQRYHWKRFVKADV